MKETICLRKRYFFTLLNLRETSPEHINSLEYITFKNSLVEDDDKCVKLKG